MEVICHNDGDLRRYTFSDGTVKIEFIYIKSIIYEDLTILEIKFYDDIYAHPSFYNRANLYVNTNQLEEKINELRNKQYLRRQDLDFKDNYKIYYENNYDIYPEQNLPAQALWALMNNKDTNIKIPYDFYLRKVKNNSIISSRNKLFFS